MVLSNGTLAREQVTGPVAAASDLELKWNLGWEPGYGAADAWFDERAMAQSPPWLEAPVPIDSSQMGVVDRH